MSLRLGGRHGRGLWKVPCQQVACADLIFGTRVVCKWFANGLQVVFRTCGYRSPPPTVSDTNRVVVLFHTDFIVTARGFKIEWQEIE